MSLVRNADSTTSGEQKTLTVCVEGNIGCGKSTFLSLCDEYASIEVIAEPVEQWMNVAGVNLLENFYADPSTWAIAFQSYVTLTMLKGHLQPVGTPIKVIERSLGSARHCFVEGMLADGVLSPCLYAILQEWYQFIDDKFVVKPDLIIYLRTTPTVAYDRMRSRSRPEEGGVPLQYLSRLHQLHEDWIESEQYAVGTPVVIIDADRSLAALQLEYAECISNILYEV